MKLIKSISLKDKRRWVAKGFIPRKVVDTFLSECDGKYFILIDKEGRCFYELKAYETDEREYERYKTMLERICVASAAPKLPAPARGGTPMEDK